MFVGSFAKGLHAKRISLHNKQANNSKRHSWNSKENKKSLSHFNLNGIITLGGNGIYGYHKRNSKNKSSKGAKTSNKAGSSSSNFNFSNLKKNLASKQKVLYSSLNQPNMRYTNFNRSQK